MRPDLKQTVGNEPTDSSTLHEKMVAMNEALVLGALRQHELTEAANSLNALLQAEIIDRKQAEQSLREAQTQLMDHAGQLEGLVSERTAALTAANKQLEALVYSMAHDLRAPLRAMQAFSTLLVEEAGAGLSKTGKDYAARISKAAQSMDAMLIGLVAFSRISQHPIELTSVKLETVVESALAHSQKDIQQKKARVESSGPWPSVLADEAIVTEVLFNLVSNSLRFTSNNVAPWVRLRAEEQSGFTRVWVEDNGIGIAPCHQVQVFALFTRLEGEKYEGTGLGLAIVQKGIERMGGRVGVEAISGEGSRFWFELRTAP